MARTYRKNVRHFNKIRGELVDYRWRKSRSNTMKGKGRRVIVQKDWDDDDYRCGGGFRMVVLVCDSENWSRSAGKARKKMYHKIDRARFKQALRNNEDAHIKSSMDPWDWD